MNTPGEESGTTGVPYWLEAGAAISWRSLVVLVGLVVAGAAFYRLRVIVVPLVASLFLSTILAPPARWLHRHHWPRSLAALFVFVIAGGVLTGVTFGFLPTIRKQFALLGKEVIVGLHQTERWLVHGPLHLSQSQVGSIVASLTKVLNLSQTALLRGALSGVTIAAEVLGGLLLTIVLTFFFVKEGDRMWEAVISKAGSEYRRTQLRELGVEVWGTLTGYVRGTTFNGVVNATALSVALIILGVPLVVPIALVTIVGSFLPLVGGIVSGLLAALVALVTQGPLSALVVVGATVVIHNMEGYLTGPLVLGRAVRLHPVAILLVLAVGSILGHILGAFLAVPLASVVLAAGTALRRSRILMAQSRLEERLGVRPRDGESPPPSVQPSGAVELD